MSSQRDAPEFQGREQAIHFGPGGRLVGILCEPAADQRITGAPAMIVSNIGFNHRAAPFRLWVDLARRLATLGFTTLRFDSSGLGDSAPRPDTQVGAPVIDMRDAMAWLTEWKRYDRFVLMGLCSGTDAAHALTTTDPHIVGAVFIDGYTYPTFTSVIRHRLLRLWSHRHWARLLRRLRLGISRSAQASDEIFVREYPSRSQMAADIETMLVRQAHLLFVYTSDVEHVYNYTDQFHDMLAPAHFRGRLELERQPEADHLFSLPAQRQWLLDRIATFMLQHWAMPR